MYLVDVLGDPPQKPTPVVGFFMGATFARKQGVVRGWFKS